MSFTDLDSLASFLMFLKHLVVTSCPNPLRTVRRNDFGAMYHPRETDTAIKVNTVPPSGFMLESRLLMYFRHMHKMRPELVCQS